MVAKVIIALMGVVLLGIFIAITREVLYGMAPGEKPDDNKEDWFV